MARVDVAKEDINVEQKMPKKKGSGPTYKKRSNNSNGNFKLGDAVSRIKITSTCSPKMLKELSKYTNLDGVSVNHTKR